MSHWITYIIIIALFIVWFLLKSRGSAKGIRTITTKELREAIKDKNKQFIDVRTPGEYKGNHIREFKNIPLNQLSQKLNLLTKDKEVIVICQSGMRSAKASKILKQNGFDKVTNVRGGMSAW